MPVQAGFARIAALLADPAREAILVALSDDRALPAGELAKIAGISSPSASGHLRKLVEGGVLTVWTQGRFRYFRISGEDMAQAIEALARASTPSASRILPARAAHLREARCCYNHLAGRVGVSLAAGLEQHGFTERTGDSVTLTERGAHWALKELGLDRASAAWRDLRLCLDWSERRFHLAGPLPSALLLMLLKTECLKRGAERGLRVTTAGRAWFAALGITT